MSVVVFIAAMNNALFIINTFSELLLVVQVLGPDLDPPATCPAAYAHLMVQCMQRNAPARPSFKIIARALETLGSLAWE